MRVSSSLAEINVVPLVDVMLVLLVIFMVAAPMMQQGFQVHLPQARSIAPAVSEPITVTVPLTFRARRARCILGKKRSVSTGWPSAFEQDARRPAVAKNVMLAGDGAVTLQAI